MGEIRHQVDPVLFFIAAFAPDEQPLCWARQQAEGRFGPVALESETFRFDEFTRYYSPEMGPVLYKRFWAFEQCIDPSELTAAKRLTNDWELKSPTIAGIARPLNLDPGYIELGKLVLASTKDFAHRIYLSQGIYAEITLIYTKKRWTALPWTYADYQSDGYHAFFTQCREYLAQKRKSSAGAR